MGLGDHLRELRNRLIFALVGIGLGAIGGWFLYDPVVAFMSAPLKEITDTNAQMNFETISAALDLKLRVSISLGVLVSSPWWIYQVAAFIGPGLKRKEKLMAGAFGLAGFVLFAAGAVTGVWVAPRAVSILVSFVPSDAAALVSGVSYINFYTYLVIAFGLSFLVPELLVAASFMGVVKSRTLVRAWRVAVVVAFAFAAVINPIPNPLPMIIQALGMLGLYYLAVLIAFMHERNVARRTRETLAAAD
jgi:sec-independent protein translocase protein TatC